MRLYDYIDQGGLIMYLLVALNVIGFAIMISKFIGLSSQGKKVSEIVGSLSEKIKGTSGANDANTLIELSKQELNVYISDQEKGLNTVKIIASISPLLGLLGTVIGVLLSFQVMAKTGVNDPSNFANGISMALLTTVGGMIVAIPHYIGHNYLVGMVDALEGKLEKELISKVL